LPGHSAHIGQEVEVHYRWHPLHGRHVKLCGSEQRGTGRFVYVEAAPGIVTLVAAWMLDPVICAGMEIDVPRVAVTALVDLHHLLAESGLRSSSLNDSNIVQEEQSDQIAKVGANRTAIAADGTASAQHCVRFRPASRDESVRARESARESGEPLDAGRRRRDGGA
jgi:hypothetical protein